MHNYKSALAEAQILLSEAGVVSSRLDATLLLAHAMNLSRERILGYPETLITLQEYEHFMALVQRRAAREPFSHIMGKREFYGREFTVTRATLDPRPDSETLIELVLTHKPFSRILDLGTGTGCLLLTALAEMPEAKGVGVDISPEALMIARRNADRLGLTSRVEFIESRWTEKLRKSDDPAALAEREAAGFGVKTPASSQNIFDLIISNPPYIPSRDILKLEPEVQKFEPHLALDGGEDGFSCYRQIASEVKKILSPNGKIVFEIGEGQGNDLRKIMSDNGLSFVVSQSDLSGIERALMFSH